MTQNKSILENITPANIIANCSNTSIVGTRRICFKKMYNKIYTGNWLLDRIPLNIIFAMFDMCKHSQSNDKDSKTLVESLFSDSETSAEDDNISLYTDGTISNEDNLIASISPMEFLAISIICYNSQDTFFAYSVCISMQKLNNQMNTDIEKIPYLIVESMLDRAIMILEKEFFGYTGVKLNSLLEEYPRLKIKGSFVLWCLLKACGKGEAKALETLGKGEVFGICDATGTSNNWFYNDIDIELGLKDHESYLGYGNSLLDYDAEYDLDYELCFKKYFSDWTMNFKEYNTYCGETSPVLTDRTIENNNKKIHFIISNENQCSSYYDLRITSFICKLINGKITILSYEPFAIFDVFTSQTIVVNDIYTSPDRLKKYIERGIDII